MGDTNTGLQLRSLIKKSGELELSLVSVPTPEPGPDEVVVRVEASPINPSDLGLLIGAADMSTAKASGTKDAPVITAKVPDAAMRTMAGRLDQSMPVGNEGAGVVVKTGSSDAAKALMGKTVAMIGGAMYSQYRTMRVRRVPAAARRHHGRRRRVLLRQSADRARHDRDHAARGPQGAGAHRGRLQPRPDAQQDLPQGRHRPRQHRAQQGAGRPPAQDRRQTCRRFHRADLHGRSHQRAGGDRRHDRVRCHRRRQARRADPHLHGDRGQQDRKGLQPLRLERAQAGLYLRQPRYRVRPN